MTKELIKGLIIQDLGANFKTTDLTLLGALIDSTIENALFISNRKQYVTDETTLNNQLDVLYPEIMSAVKITYLQRGAEDVKSQSLSGISSTFNDPNEKLRNDIIKNCKRVVR